MKKFHIAEIFVIIALIVGIFIGKSLTNDRGYYKNYYFKAEKAYQKAKDANTPPVTEENPKRLARVMTLYRKVFEKYRDSGYADNALFELGQMIDPTTEEAQALFRRLIVNYPDSEFADDSLYTIGMGYYRKGEFDKALVTFDKLIKEYPTTQLMAEARFNHAMCYYGKEEFDKALEKFDKFEEDYRATSKLIHSARFYVGMTYFGMADLEKARAEFLNVVDLEIEDLSPEAQFNIGQTYFAGQKYDEAIEAYQKTVEKFPESKSAEYALFFIGNALQKQDKNEEAIERMEQAIEEHPDSEHVPRYQAYIAEIYRGMGDTEEAVNNYRKIADNDEYYYDLRRSAQYRIGKIYEDGNLFDKAIEEYEKLLKDFPRYHTAPTHPSNLVEEGYIRHLRSKMSGASGEL